MPLHLLPATAADAARIAAIERAAYQPEPLNSVLFPGPFPADILSVRAAELVDEKRRDPSMRWLKVVDRGTDNGGDGGEVIAFSSWHLYHPKPLPAEILPPSVPQRTDGINLAACGRVFGGIGKMQDEVMGGRDYIYIKSVLTDPAHQRRGAGALLVQAVIAEADRLGLPTYLTSSPAGRSLYFKNGFVEVATTETDVSEWKEGGVHVTWGMVRETKQ